MTEITIVRENLMTKENYTPYCGSVNDCYMARVKWIAKLNQFKCPKCGWISEFPDDFIKRYRERWGK